MDLNHPWAYDLQAQKEWGGGYPAGKWDDGITVLSSAQIYMANDDIDACQSNVSQSDKSPPPQQSLLVHEMNIFAPTHSRADELGKLDNMLNSVKSEPEGSLCPLMNNESLTLTNGFSQNLCGQATLEAYTNSNIPLTDQMPSEYNVGKVLEIDTQRSSEDLPMVTDKRNGKAQVYSSSRIRTRMKDNAEVQSKFWAESSSTRTRTRARTRLNSQPSSSENVRANENTEMDNSLKPRSSRNRSRVNGSTKTAIFAQPTLQVNDRATTFGRVQAERTPTHENLAATSVNSLNSSDVARSVSPEVNLAASARGNPNGKAGVNSSAPLSPPSKDEPYARLIFRALLSAPQHTMVLKDIYEWFRRNTDKAKDEDSGSKSDRNGGTSRGGRGRGRGWQNSIRHNLSMNGAFVKVVHYDHEHHHHHHHHRNDSQEHNGTSIGQRSFKSQHTRDTSDGLNEISGSRTTSNKRKRNFQEFEDGDDNCPYSIDGVCKCQCNCNISSSQRTEDARRGFKWRLTEAALREGVKSTTRYRVRAASDGSKSRKTNGGERHVRTAKPCNNEDGDSSTKLLTTNLLSTETEPGIRTKSSTSEGNTLADPLTEFINPADAGVFNDRASKEETDILNTCVPTIGQHSMENSIGLNPNLEILNLEGSTVNNPNGDREEGKYRDPKKKAKRISNPEKLLGNEHVSFEMEADSELGVGLDLDLDMGMDMELELGVGSNMNDGLDMNLEMGLGVEAGMDLGLDMSMDLAIDLDMGMNMERRRVVGDEVKELQSDIGNRTGKSNCNNDMDEDKGDGSLVVKNKQNRLLLDEETRLTQATPVEYNDMGIELDLDEGAGISIEDLDQLALIQWRDEGKSGVNGSTSSTQKEAGDEIIVNEREGGTKRESGLLPTSMATIGISEMIEGVDGEEKVFNGGNHEVKPSLSECFSPEGRDGMMGQNLYMRYLETDYDNKYYYHPQIGPGIHEGGEMTGFQCDGSFVNKYMEHQGDVNHRIENFASYAEKGRCQASYISVGREEDQDETGFYMTSLTDMRKDWNRNSVARLPFNEGRVKRFSGLTRYRSEVESGGCGDEVLRYFNAKVNQNRPGLMDDNLNGSYSTQESLTDVEEILQRFTPLSSKHFDDERGYLMMQRALTESSGLSVGTNSVCNVKEEPGGKSGLKAGGGDGFEVFSNSMKSGFEAKAFDE